MKTVDQLVPDDFLAHRVWEFAIDKEAELGGETFVRPVAKIPVKSLSNRVVAAPVLFANGQRFQGLLGNLDLADPVRTDHFLTLTLYLPSRQRFLLARYFDLDYSERGPSALAAKLGLALDAIFPMSYDITDFALGDQACLRGTIAAAPATRLSRAEIIALAVESGGT